MAKKQPTHTKSSSKRWGSEAKAKAVAFILGEIASSGRSLTSVCSKEGMPPITTFIDWVNKDKSLAEQYARV